jgi:hypothetical protein
MNQYQHHFSIVCGNFWLKMIAGIVNVWLIGITMNGYAAPIITTDLADIVVISGTAASLQISAYDSMPLNYQWYLNTTNIPGATNAFLTFNSIQTTNAGRYNVTVTNLSGSITSRVVTVTVENYPNPTTIVA